MAVMLLNVSLGGAIGSNLRYLTVYFLTRMFGLSYLLGVLPLNIIGSFMMTGIW